MKKTRRGVLLELFYFSYSYVKNIHDEVWDKAEASLLEAVKVFPTTFISILPTSPLSNASSSKRLLFSFVTTLRFNGLPC